MPLVRCAGWLGLLLQIFAAVSLVAADEPKRSEPVLDLPSVDGFERSEPKHFPNPKQGYVVNYAAQPDIWVNVYVYNSGLDRIPDGASSNVVKQEIDLIDVGLKELTRNGIYKTYRERAGDERRIGDAANAPKAQRRLFEIDRADIGRILTDVYITGYKDHFVKIRFSYPADKQAASEQAVAPLLTAIGKLLAS